MHIIDFITPDRASQCRNLATLARVFCDSAFPQHMGSTRDDQALSGLSRRWEPERANA
jgi:hypothetical protein